VTCFNDIAQTGCDTRMRQSVRENPSHASPSGSGDALVTRLRAFPLKFLIRARARGVYQKRVATRHRVTRLMRVVRRRQGSHAVTCARRRKPRHAIGLGTADPHRTHNATWSAHAAGRLESSVARLAIGYSSRRTRPQPCETIASATRNRQTSPDRQGTALVFPRNQHGTARPRAYCWAPRTPCRAPGLVQVAPRSERPPRPAPRAPIAPSEAP
jgi:hypothetical protein